MLGASHDSVLSPSTGGVGGGYSCHECLSAC